MTIDTKDILNSILSSISRIDYIKPEEIPGIDLYMDQVTTFMEEHLRSSKRYKEDKILTKTMINNYAKNDLLPPPVFIYYFKSILSISDIQKLLEPITQKYFSGEGSIDLTSLYEEIMKLELEQIEPLAKDVTRKFSMAGDSFQEVPEEEKDFLHKFAFICMLSFDVYVKKQVIENLIDQMTDKEKEE